MKKNDLIDYWLESSNKDYKTMKNLYRSKDYHWSLFMGHLVLEKLFKAHFIKLIDINPPKTHDLLRLVEKSNLNVNEKQKEILDTITTFNINSRYPDYKKSFYKKCSKEYTFQYIERIEELRKWLLKLLIQK